MEYGGKLIMETLLEILNDIDDTVDWENETALIDDRILDSFGVISLISELEDQFEVEIDASEIVPENFNSADAMWKMIQRLQEN
jgi:D-alanine--poly(phosphoribitol) ligase subunit 2